MQTHLSAEFAGTAQGEEGADILRKCVHCGFCNATCPTYQLLGDELDGPRGRIYLIKQVLEGAPVTRSTQVHLDRCLTCLACQTTCPSGVDYGHLVDIGRKIVDARVSRPAAEKSIRWVLKEGLTSAMLAPAMRLARALRPLLPRGLKINVPARSSKRQEPARLGTHSRKMLLLQGCVQPAMLPNIDRATARVLDRAGIELIRAAGTGCCGAIRKHLSDYDGGLGDMRRNIDAWEPLLASGEVEAIVSSASACALSLKDYAHALAGEPQYASKAKRISTMTKDLSELLPDLVPALRDQIRLGDASRVAVHLPCTLQHGQRLGGGVEPHLRAFGFNVTPCGDEDQMCCGSAGTYSILQPQLASQLRDRKLRNLAKLEPQIILSANIGCIKHLQSGTTVPVKHWIELLDEVLV
jgi:glycolate oxidase iron-sulfur subunit